VTADPLLARLDELQDLSACLDPDPAGRAALRDPVIAYAERFLDALPSLPAFVETDDRGIGLLEQPIGEEPVPIETLLELLGRHVDRAGLNAASAGHLGYIPGGGIYASALGDYLADVTNRYAGVFFSSPGAVRMEHQLNRWMADLVGYPAGAAGTSCSGGSIANLTALAAAREAHRIRARDVERTVVYLTSQTHHCVAKALRILGLGECMTRMVPLDDRYRMRPEALDRLVQADRREGLRPWLVVGSAGSTDVGAVDPLEAIGDVAAARGLWYHVDGAYGAFFALTDHGRRILRGMDRSDSIVMDPHKTLFLPYGSGVVLVRNPEHLLAAFRSEAPYLQDTLKATEELSPTDLSPELTRPSRGPRLWLPLLVHGVAAFRAALEEKLLLARYFHREVARLGFEVGPEPDLSVVIYRYVPARMRAGDVPRDEEAINRINRAMLEAIHRDGRVFISSTDLDGAYTLRFACVVHRTHRDTVDQLLAELATLAHDLDPSAALAPARGT
jgi:glutamate/tyrosine decarboxylase-like PLP-dependent enzyme